jgi:Uma2 family endonuclease
MFSPYPLLSRRRDLARAPHLRHTSAMNAPVPPGIHEARRPFTVEEFLAVAAADVFAEGEHVELWDGEMVLAPSEGGTHFNVKAELLAWLVRCAPSGVKVGPTGPLRIGERTLLEPYLFWFEPRGRADIPEPAQMRLVIEVAVTSLARDRTDKALKYAQAGIEDYWVVDAESLTTWVHRKPSAEGYGDVRECAPGDAISPLAAQDVTVRIGELFE